jgi:ParB family chromosome partitioning protein
MRAALGKGLSALISDDTVASVEAKAAADAAPSHIPLSEIHPNPKQPRRHFDESALAELSASIKEKGVLQPILVAQTAEHAYEIIAGERRWRAAQRAGLHDVPIAVVDATDAQSLEFAIIENVQRADLNAMEEASGYVALMEQCNHTQDEVAQIVGKSRPHIANMVRLLKLSEPVKMLVRSGKLSAGHARLLVGQPKAEEIATEIVAKDLSVRLVEQMVREQSARPALDTRRQGGGAAGKDADTRAVEKRLSDALGLQVKIDHRGKGGTLHIKYQDLDQLDAVLKKLDR